MQHRYRGPEDPVVVRLSDNVSVDLTGLYCSVKGCSELDLGLDFALVLMGLKFCLNMMQQCDMD